MHTVSALPGPEISRTGGGDEVVALPALELHRIRLRREGPERDCEEPATENIIIIIIIIIIITDLSLVGSVQNPMILGLLERILQVSYSSLLTLYITCLSISSSSDSLSYLGQTILMVSYSWRAVALFTSMIWSVLEMRNLEIILSSGEGKGELTLDWLCSSRGPATRSSRE